MKFITVLAVALLPMTALAAPTADANPNAAAEAAAAPIADVEVAEPDVPPISSVDARDLFKRSTQYCQIVNSESRVYCRTGPGTGYPVNYSMVPNGRYYFTCWKNGVSVGGNTSWDYSSTYNCYVAGYYTDGNCTPARLGLC